MSNVLKLVVENVEEYKKDDQGKIIDRFLLLMDRLLRHYKAINSQSVTFIEGGSVRIQSENRLTGSDVIVDTISAFGNGAIDLDSSYVKPVAHIFNDYSFTIEIGDFIELRKSRGANTPVSLEIKDKEYLKLVLIEGDEYIFKYNPEDVKAIDEFIDVYLNNTEDLNEESLAMDSEEAVKIKELRATEMIKLVFDTENGTIHHSGYYDNGNEGLHELDLCKKFLVGYDTKKKKGIDIPSDIEADLYRFSSSWTEDTLIFTIIRIINETHTVEQVFISLDMLDE